MQHGDRRILSPQQLDPHRFGRVLLDLRILCEEYVGGEKKLSVLFVENCDWKGGKNAQTGDRTQDLRVISTTL